MTLTHQPPPPPFQPEPSPSLPPSFGPAVDSPPRHRPAPGGGGGTPTNRQRLMVNLRFMKYRLRVMVSVALHVEIPATQHPNPVHKSSNWREILRITGVFYRFVHPTSAPPCVLAHHEDRVWTVMNGKAIHQRQSWGLFRHVWWPLAGRGCARLILGHVARICALAQCPRAFFERRHFDKLEPTLVVEWASLGGRVVRVQMDP